MDPSRAPNLTNMLNSAIRSTDPENSNSQYFQQIAPSQFTMNLLASSQYHPNLHPYHPSLHPFAHHPGMHQLPYTQENFQGVPCQTNSRPPTHMPYGATQAGLSSSPVESGAFFGAHGAGGSRGDESGSPMSALEKNKQHEVENEESSGSSPDEERRRGRSNWTQEENERLINSWLKNSVDSVDGNAKKSEYYWKQVAEKYSRNSPRNQRRSAAQCKGHWNKTTPSVSLFHASYMKAKNMYASGQSDDGLMNKARAFYLNAAKVKRPFALEYWWNVVKEQPKWHAIYTEGDANKKRQKLDALGAYTSSSNQDSEETNAAHEPRPQGQKSAKEARKGKGKGKGKGTSALFPIQLSEETSELLRGGNDRKAIALEKWAEATTTKAVADKELAEARKERAKVDKFSMYMELMKVDTSGFNDIQLQRHEKMVESLCKEFS